MLHKCITQTNTKEQKKYVHLYKIDYDLRKVEIKWSMKDKYSANQKY